MKKRLVAVVVMLAVVVAAWSLAAHPALRSPERTVAHMLDAMQAGRLAKADRDTLAGSLLPVYNNREEALYQAMLAEMRYAITDVAETEDTAEVTVTLTCVDMPVLMAETASSLLEHSLGSGQRTGRYDQQLIAQIEAGRAATVETIVTARLEQRDGVWKVDMENSPALLAALSGNLL